MKITTTPTLSFLDNTWVLSAPIKPGNIVVKVYIKHAWNGESWNSYKFTVCDDLGEELTLINQEEYLNEYQMVLEMEGEEAAEEFSNGHTFSINAAGYTTEWKFAMQLVKRWEAMLELGLFQPSVTI